MGPAVAHYYWKHWSIAKDRAAEREEAFQALHVQSAANGCLRALEVVLVLFSGVIDSVGGVSGRFTLCEWRFSAFKVM